MWYIYLNFNDLNDEAQEDLMNCARDEIDKEELAKECLDNWRSFDQILHERASSKLHTLDIVFNI